MEMMDHISIFKDILNKGILDGSISISDFEIYEDALLSKYTSFKTGGKAFVFAPKNANVLSRIFPEMMRNGIKYFVLGNGTNTLALDSGYDGIIILLTMLDNAKVNENEVYAECGYNLTRLSALCRDNSLSGFEFAYGIPGTVGGAVFMNAGAYGGEISDIIISAKVLYPSGEIKTIDKSKMKLGYRTSAFQNENCIILSAIFKLKSGDKEMISAQMKDFMSRRKEKQPLEYPSAGSTFKRLEGRYTAQLIDENGLKGKRIGGAMVSEKHAGFIINYDNARSDDILHLIRFIQDRIYESIGEHIQTEIRIIE